MKRYVRVFAEPSPAELAEKMTADVMSRGWFSSLDESWAEEFVVFYMEGEFHLFGMDPVGHVSLRYDKPEDVAEEMLKFMDSKYKKYRGDLN